MVAKREKEHRAARQSGASKGSVRINHERIFDLISAKSEMIERRGELIVASFEKETWVIETSALLSEEAGQLVFYSHFPVKIPRELQAEMLELLARVNLRLTSGNFDFNFANGEISFRNDRLLDSSGCHDAQIDENLETMTRWFPAIASVFAGVYDPIEAIDTVLAAAAAA